MSGQRWTLDTAEKRQFFNSHIAQMLQAGKKPVVQFVRPLRNPKTPDQIRYAHSLCQALADHAGVPLEEAKTDAKREFGVIHVSTSTITGDRTARLVSFSDYKKDEMSGFISAMEHHLISNNIPFMPAAL